MTRFIIFFCLVFFFMHTFGQTVSKNIHINQFGYLPDAQKIAVLSNPQQGFNSGETYIPGATIKVFDNATSSEVFSGSSEQWMNGSLHGQSGDQVWWFDFSSVNIPGEYYIYDPSNDVKSHIFRIDPNVYFPVLRETMRAFFFQRCGVEKNEQFGGVWNDTVCHHGIEQDLDCKLVTNPIAETSKDLSGGWHDAGDYNKYVNYSHDPLHDLLFAFEENPAIWGDDHNIPESGNGIPDILDEIKIELDWLLKMQNSDGSTLMKVSVTGFQSSSPPSADLANRRYGPAQASATRAVASIFSHASIVYNLAGVSEFADTLLARAELAWSWVQLNPSYSNYDNAGFSSSNPEVSNSTQDDYLACASVYLFAATGNSIYRTYFDNNYSGINPYAWGYWYLFQTSVQDAMLYYSDLPDATPTVAMNIRNSFINSMHTNNTSMLTAYLDSTDAYRAYLQDNDYVWGNNREKAHASIMYHHLNQYNLDNGGSDDSLNYANAADGYFHFLNGVNPLNKVMLSNMYNYGADDCINEVYHGWFNDGTDYDNALTSIYGPAPGIVPGGINPNYMPDPSYVGPPLEPPLNQPIQKSYKDWNTGYPENSWELTENSITYQAAFVHMMSKYVASPSDEVNLVLGQEFMKLLWNPTPNTFKIHGETGGYSIQVLDKFGNIYQTFFNDYNTIIIDNNILPDEFFFVLVSKLGNGKMHIQKILKQ